MSHDNEKDFEMNKEFTHLAQALREARPSPEPEFTESLDQAVADHFPPEWAEKAALGDKSSGRIGGLAERFRRRLDGRRILLPAMAGFAGLLVVATVVVGAVESGRLGVGGGGGQDDAVTNQLSMGSADSSAGPAAGGSVSDAVEEAVTPAGTRLYGAMEPESGAFSDEARPTGDAMRTAGGGNRDVAREAEITLGTDPDGVQDVANEVVSVTDDHNGIVMNSNVVDGEAGRAGASFNLLIPSGEIESAVADLSGIADLRSRSQELTDITAPVNKTEDAIADSKAKIKSLQGELEETYDEGERANLERRIRWERYDLRAAETRLKRLERRVDYTPVSLQVETSGDTSSDGSTWGLTDAVDDAGKLLGVAAGVTVLALAVAIPIGIVVLIALALNRAWVRRSRRRALADE